MSLQKRLLLYLLACAPLVWALALALSVQLGRHEVDELFDSEMVRLARQVQAMLDAGAAAAGTAGAASGAETTVRRSTVASTPDLGEASLGDLSVAVWDRQGRRLFDGGDGVALPGPEPVDGFVDRSLSGAPWRLYTLSSADGVWRVAVGQALNERREVSLDLSLGQVLPWLLMLPLLLAAMAWAVRRALAPLRELTAELQGRDARDLRPLPDAATPADLRPMVGAVNGWLDRVRAAVERERRFTADAAHELRTPLAVLRAQWDVTRRAADGAERRHAEAQLTAGLDRMDRLVTQLLALSRVEARAAALGGERLAREPAAESPAPVAAVPAPDHVAQAAVAAVQVVPGPVDWPAIVEQVASDCLALAGRRGVELAVDWPRAGAPLPLAGDPALLAVMLRNLVDNALRYARAGSLVQLRFEADRLEIDNEAEPPGPELLARLGERFHRPDGQEEGGSGLGVSIARRVAELHGLRLQHQAAPGGAGWRVLVTHLGA